MALPLQPGGSIEERTLQYAARSYYLASRTGGRVFFVDGTDGNDDADNPGTHPFAPVLTVTRALALCVANNGDIIQIIKNSPSSPPGDETFPIAVNKDGVTIRGTLGKGLLSDSGIGSDEQNVACFQIAANYVTIEDLYLGVDDLGTTGGVVEFSGATYGTTIRNCTFDTQRETIAYGVYSTGDQPYLLIEDCVFGAATSYSAAHIYVANASFGVFRRNLHRSFTGIAISLPATAHNITILDNWFRLPSDTKGKAITLADGSSTIHVEGNHANFGMTDMTNNPYLDLNNDTSNTWGLNYKGVTATLPANA